MNPVTQSRGEDEVFLRHLIHVVADLKTTCEIYRKLFDCDLSRTKVALKFGLAVEISILNGL